MKKERLKVIQGTYNRNDISLVLQERIAIELEKKRSENSLLSLFEPIPLNFQENGVSFIEYLEPIQENEDVSQKKGYINSIPTHFIEQTYPLFPKEIMIPNEEHISTVVENVTNDFFEEEVSFATSLFANAFETKGSDHQIICSDSHFVFSTGKSISNFVSSSDFNMKTLGEMSDRLNTMGFVTGGSVPVTRKNYIFDNRFTDKNDEDFFGSDDPSLFANIGSDKVFLITDLPKGLVRLHNPRVECQIKSLDDFIVAVIRVNVLYGISNWRALVGWKQEEKPLKRAYVKKIKDSPAPKRAYVKKINRKK